MLIVFHINRTQPHQCEHGIWFTQGFKRHGLTLEITADREKDADIHIVSGNHYAKDRWVGHQTLWLDKRFYRNDPKPPGMHSDPCVSLGWMTPTGGRKFTKGEGRPPPDVETNTGEGTIYLCEYGERPPVGGDRFDLVRRHPQDETPPEPLTHALRRHKKAVGQNTTALVEAALLGLEIECLDPEYILNEPDWLELLPYADWRYDEFDKAIEHLWQRL